tara:strand:- start:176 stop:1270 length:1095 start_codon:yes stop_codon:yes gene_type:complete
MTYQVINVPLGERSYKILVGYDLLVDESYFRNFSENNFVVITNDVIAPLYLDKLTKTLNKLKKKYISLILSDGEKNKNLNSLNLIYDFLLQNKCDRKVVLIALGGGVIGDITGFAASTYMRGVSFIQIPTTLLSQVDSSVGGKTAINHTMGKNLIGSFYQPKSVLIDVLALNTLSNREICAGIAEIIKYGVIVDYDFFKWLEKNIQKIKCLQKEETVYAIKKSCEIKSQIVIKDEKETGLRAILNFGHTFGHAIELGLGYGNWLHGEAVGCGMIMAAELSSLLGYINNYEKIRIKEIIKQIGLPVYPPDFGFDRWLSLIELDKKNIDNNNNFVILEKLGKAKVDPVSNEILKHTIRNCLENKKS